MDAKGDSGAHGGMTDAVDGEPPELTEIAQIRVSPSFYILQQF